MSGFDSRPGFHFTLEGSVDRQTKRYGILFALLCLLGVVLNLMCFLIAVAGVLWLLKAFGVV